MKGSDDEPLWRTEARWLAAIAARLADPGFPTGDHAALRRMAPDAPSGHAEIAAERLFGAVNADPEGKDRRRWLLIVHCLARSSPDFSRSVQPNGLICKSKCGLDDRRVFPCNNAFLFTQIDD